MNIPVVYREQLFTLVTINSNYHRDWPYDCDLQKAGLAKSVMKNIIGWRTKHFAMESHINGKTTGMSVQMQRTTRVSQFANLMNVFR